MGTLKPTGVILGLLGAALAAWSIYTLLTAAGCAGMACAENFGGPIAALPTGIVIAMIGIFMGGGTIALSGLFLGVGLGAMGAAAFGNVGAMQGFGWLFGGIFFASGLLPILLLGGGRKLAARKQAEANALIRSGVKGVGTVTGVRDTGITINDNPRVEITMRVEPIDGSAAVERSKAVTVPRVAIPRAGERYPVWFDPADPSKWAYGTDMEDSAAPEIKEMFARAAARAEPPALAPDSAVGEIERLSDLWKSGALTDREFADAKARLIGQIGR